MPLGPPVSDTTCTMPYSQATWTGGGVRVGRGWPMAPPSSGWSRPLPAQLGPSAQADTREGRAKPPQGDLRTSMWLQWLKGRSRATPHTHTGPGPTPAPWLLGARGAQRDPSSAHSSSRIHLSVPPGGERQTVSLSIPLESSPETTGRSPFVLVTDPHPPQNVL